MHFTTQLISPWKSTASRSIPILSFPEKTTQSSESSRLSMNKGDSSSGWTSLCMWWASWAFWAGFCSSATEGLGSQRCPLILLKNTGAAQWVSPLQNLLSSSKLWGVSRNSSWKKGRKYKMTSRTYRIRKTVDGAAHGKIGRSREKWTNIERECCTSKENDKTGSLKSKFQMTNSKRKFTSSCWNTTPSSWAGL